MRKPAELEALDASRILDLDVRDDLRAGREPFQRIMRARHALAEDGVLRLRAIFEPKPLYAVLGREGFVHWTEKLADDDWLVWFYRAHRGPGEAQAEGDDQAPHPLLRSCSEGFPPPSCAGPRPKTSDVLVLDVRGLEPPEPMERTLEALASLPPGHTLVQLNDRVPRFLLPELERRGFRYTIHDEDPHVVRVFIQHLSP